MQQQKPALKRLLGEGSGLARRFIHAQGASYPLGDLCSLSAVAGSPEELAGRSILLRTATQEAAAMALIACDGRARRIVIAPPDLSLAHGRQVLDDAEIDLILSDSEGSGLDDARPVLTCGPQVLAQGRPAPIAPAEIDTEWVMLTSGTTGAPKMVVHSRAGLTAAIKPMAPGAPPPVWATFYDIRRYGGLQILLRALLGTGSMVLSAAGEAPHDHLLRLGRLKVSHISGTPSHWRRVLMTPEHRAMAPAYIRLSGEIADQAVLDHLRHAYPEASIGHAYASTEAGVGFEVTDGREGFPADYLGLRGDVDMKVEDGSLRIRSTRTASRYVAPSPFGAAPSTAGAAPSGVVPAAGVVSAMSDLSDREGFVDTDDLVERRGERYYFVGRRSGIINVGGLKLHPEEVEAVINRHEAVRMALVKPRANPITGAVVVADVVLREDALPVEDAAGRAALKEAILRLCRDNLAYHKVPVLLRFVPSLTVNAAGKLSRSHA